MAKPSKFIQINTTGTIENYIESLEKIIDLENPVIENIQSIVDQRREEARHKAEKLYAQRELVLNVCDPYKYNRFNELGKISLDKSIIGKVIKASDDLIKDINIVRDWLVSYKAFSEQVEWLNIQELHDELLMLGKSILGRAIELCPYKTGYLRDSARLYDFGDYIVISFNASYASYVHEIMENHHDIGQAKFLEQAAQEFIPDDTVWVNIEGYSGVRIVISVNPLYVTYIHYGEG